MMKVALFEFYRDYFLHDEKIVNKKNPSLVYEDVFISSLKLSPKTLSLLSSRGLKRLSLLIVTTNQLLFHYDFDTITINEIYQAISLYFSEHEKVLPPTEEVPPKSEVIKNPFEVDKTVGETTEVKSELSENEGKTIDNLFITSQPILKDEPNPLAGEIKNNTPIEELKLSVRSYNCLKRANIQTIGELLKLGEFELIQIKNLGIKSIQEIQGVIRKSQVLKDEPKLEVDMKYLDKSIKELNLSVRSFNALDRAKIYTIRKLIEIDNANKLTIINNLGQKSIKEIKERLAIIRLGGSTESSQNIPRKFSFARLNSKDFFIEGNRIYIQSKIVFVEDFPLNIIQFPFRVKNRLEQNKMVMFSDIIHIQDEEFLLWKGFGKRSIHQMKEIIGEYLSKHIININDTIPIEIVGHQLIEIVQRTHFDGIERMEVINLLKKEYSEELILNAIDDSIKKGIIFIYEGDKLFYKYLSFPQFLYNFPKNNKKDILFSRIDGLTLEEIAKNHQVTRERIRQIQMKFISRELGTPENPKLLLREDRYRYVFEKYQISKNDFIESFHEKERTYHYLVMRYKKGNKELSEAVEDMKIAPRLRSGISKHLTKDLLRIDGITIKPNRKDLIRYFASKYCLKTRHLEDIFIEYKKFLKDNQLEIDKYTMDSHRDLEVKIAYYDFMLSKLGRLVRYYNFSQYDFTEFLEILDIKSYKNLQISTQLLMDKHPNLMKQYDVQNHYELHNLLRRLIGEKNKQGIQFIRMPIIQIGEFNRDKYVLSKLVEFEEISQSDIVNIIHQEIGIQIETLKANWLISIADYYKDGIYSYHKKTDPFTPSEIKILSNLLVEPFYFVDEIKAIYAKNVSQASIKKINSTNFRKIGYQMFDNYVIRKGLTAGEYFKNLILKFDLFTGEQFQSYKNGNYFNNVFYSLLEDLSIIEFAPKNYINIRKLEKSGFGKEDLFSFIKQVLSFVGENKFFTIHSIYKEGFTSHLDVLGFESMFYESVLRFGSEVSWTKIKGKILFQQVDNPISRVGLVEMILNQFNRMDSEELIDYLQEEYGLTLDKDDLKEIVNDTSMHYDKIMDAFYKDYDTYYEEV